MSDYRSYKWITADTTQTGKSIHVNNVSQVFGPVTKNHCNLISIFGRARQGKSFLMNCLAGEKDIFRISNEKESCTQGIDISNKWLTLNDFSRIDTGKATTSPIADMKIGFVDAEGQGDKDVSYDANLICPILLASKCVIFNWKGDLQKDHILSTLGIMTRAARNVATDSVDSAGKGDRKKFGHLHIIFRDWQSVGSDEQSTFQALFGIEGTAEGGTRDQIRSDVMESFESIRVWLFDAPSELVSDLKKKLTFDRTSQTFRSQVRSLRAALSTQLREPTLFAGQPLLGKSYNVLLNLVADSLNKGEVVLPASAYLSMMRMEVDKVKTDYENELRAGVEKLLVDIDTAASAANALYPSETDGLRQLQSLVERIGAKYEAEVQQSLGSLSSTLSAQLLADFPQQIDRINNILRDQFISSLRNQFSRWLLAARKKGETKLTSDFAALSTHKDLPLLEEADVAATLASLLARAVGLIGGSAVYPENEEVRDAEEVLTRHYQALAEKFRVHNDTLKQSLRQSVLVHLNEAVAAMKQTVQESVSGLQKSEPTGYPLTRLEQVLNKRYFELRARLTENCNKNRYTGEMEAEFKKVCGQLREEMVVEYQRVKKEALTAALDRAEQQGDAELNAISNVEFDRSVHNDAWLTEAFNKCIDRVKAAVSASVEGWLSGETDKLVEQFNADLDETLDAMAMNLSENVLALWEEIIAEEDAAEAEEAAAAAAAAAAAEMEVETESTPAYRREMEEEEDDEDVYNKSGRVFQSKLGSSVGGKDQKQRAREWAESTLNIKTTKRGAASAAARTKAAAAAAKAPAKSVEQQRADAAAFAAKTYGEGVLGRSPVKSAEKRPRPAAAADAETRADENVNANTSSSSSSGGLFGSVKNWFSGTAGAAPAANNGSTSSSAGADTTPVKKETVKKESVSPVPVTATAAAVGANGKPLTAAQLAKAEMKRAEAERVANMIATKKGKK